MHYAIQKQSWFKGHQQTRLLGFRSMKDRAEFLKSRTSSQMDIQYEPILRSELTNKEIKTFRTFAQDGVTTEGIVVYSVVLYR